MVKGSKKGFQKIVDKKIQKYYEKGTKKVQKSFNNGTRKVQNNSKMV